MNLKFLIQNETGFKIDIVMIKAFISHSSKQKKEFVEPLVELLGRDSCIIDCYDFQAAYETLEQIYRQMEKCSIFVFVVSKESLESEIG